MDVANYILSAEVDLSDSITYCAANVLGGSHDIQDFYAVVSEEFPGEMQSIFKFINKMLAVLCVYDLTTLSVVSKETLLEKIMRDHPSWAIPVTRGMASMSESTTRAHKMMLEVVLDVGEELEANWLPPMVRYWQETLEVLPIMIPSSSISPGVLVAAAIAILDGPSKNIEPFRKIFDKAPAITLGNSSVKHKLTRIAFSIESIDLLRAIGSKGILCDIWSEVGRSTGLTVAHIEYLLYEYEYKVNCKGLCYIGAAAREVAERYKNQRVLDMLEFIGSADDVRENIVADY